MPTLRQTRQRIVVPTIQARWILTGNTDGLAPSRIVRPAAMWPGTIKPGPTAIASPLPTGKQTAGTRPPAPEVSSTSTADPGQSKPRQEQ